MFPFKTKEFSFQSDLTIEQLQNRLKTSISKQKLISIKKDGKLYGKINGNKAIIELGQSFQRNSFRPVVVFKWTSSDSKTKIYGYYRVALSVIFGTLLLPVFGLYLTIQIINILPFIFCALIWMLIYVTFGRWLFNKDFKWVEEEFLNLTKR